MSRRPVAMLLLLAAAAPAAAEPTSQIYRLSPADRNAAIAAGAERGDTGALLPDPNRDAVLGRSLYADDPRPDTRVHGELSIGIGTGGARGIAGSFGVPLGSSSFAQFSFENSRFPVGTLAPYHWQRRR